MKEVRPNQWMFIPCGPIPAEQVKKNMWKDYSHFLQMYPKEKELVIAFFKNGSTKEILVKASRKDFNNVLNDIEFAWYSVSWIRTKHECLWKIVSLSKII